jgi:SAM-dependent methyltransferase
LIRVVGLGPESCLLDVGCGVGRLPIGILRRLGSIREYWGVDVDDKSLQWCGRFIERSHPTFRFARIDVENQRYNPSGQALTTAFRFPFPDRALDIVYLFSVFSHMNESDLRLYMNEFRRILVRSGKLFFTAFVEENVPRVSVNPPGYRREWSGPLHCVRYEQTFLASVVLEAGFTVDRLEHATEIDGQSAFYCSLRGDAREGTMREGEPGAPR